MIRCELRITLGLLAGCAGVAHSQVTTPDRSGAILSGAAVDSIRGGYFKGASIFISGTSLSATTDSSGRFKLRGIPPGSRYIEVQHPLLDSLGLTLVTAAQTFTDGDSSFVLISGPSARTYASNACTQEQRNQGPGVIAGTVTDADGVTPSRGSSVAASWIEYEVGKKSIKSAVQRRTAHVSPTGAFRVCGLPDDVVAMVNASRGKDSTGLVEVDLRAIVGTASLKLPSAAADAFLSGRVVDAGGKPAAGARVTVESDDATTISGEDGTFVLRGVRAGTRTLTVRKIGFEPLQRWMDIPATGLSGVSLPLGRSVAVLQKIVVTATRELGLERVGFAARKLRRPGTFFTPRDIEIRNHPSVKDLLRTVPMMRRSGCTRYFVDGWLQAPGDPDEYLSGFEIGAVEVYASGFVPAEFYSFTPSGGACKSVVIWTKWKIDRR
jgi:hypothetical protein